MKGMQHKMPTCMWLQNNRKLSRFVYSNFAILSSMFRPVDDRAGPWNTAMNAACVLHITWQLYHIGHVTSIVFHCFQGRPHHLAQLTSLWRHDFSPDTQSATDRRSIFRNLFCPSFMKQSFMASLASFCGLFFFNLSKASGFTWFWYPSGGMAVYSMAAYERVLY